MNEPPRKFSLSPVMVIVLVVIAGSAMLCCGIGAVLLPPAFQQAREARRRQQAAENLRQIGLALQNYHETHRSQKATQSTTEPPKNAASQENAVLHPDFPVVEGKYQMTEEWSIILPDKFNRRIEDGDLVIWRPGFTIWVSALNNDKNESKEDRRARLREDVSPDAFDVEDVSEEAVLRLRYRLNEESEDRRVAAFYGFVVGVNGHIQLGIYFDDEGDLEKAKQIWLSVKEAAAEQP
jgi:type II secretory pathway pseudopilin PulG